MLGVFVVVVLFLCCFFNNSIFFKSEKSMVSFIAKWDSLAIGGN